LPRLIRGLSGLVGIRGLAGLIRGLAGLIRIWSLARLIRSLAGLIRVRGLAGLIRSLARLILILTRLVRGLAGGGSLAGLLLRLTHSSGR
jgi:hypothetical protein